MGEKKTSITTINNTKPQKMKHYIQIGVHLNEKLGIKSITIEENTTELECNSELLKKICIGVLKSIDLNHEDVQIQDLFNKVGVKKS